MCRCSVPEGRGSLVISPRRRREGGSPRHHTTTGGSENTGELTTKGEPPISHTRGRDPAGSLSPQYKSGHVGRGRGSRFPRLSRPPINRRPTNSVLRKPAIPIAQTRPSGQRGRRHRQPSGPTKRACTCIMSHGYICHPVRLIVNQKNTCLRCMFCANQPISCDGSTCRSDPCAVHVPPRAATAHPNAAHHNTGLARGIRSTTEPLPPDQAPAAQRGAGTRQRSHHRGSS